jgi:hypothetical protein
MKGHPREAIGCWQDWGNRYKVTYGEEQTYVYDKLMDNVLLSFHAKDSTGKFIGMVPYGTAAENLAYLGADIAICGLPSSTYNGYDTDVDVLFILAETVEAISGTASQVAERYKADNLLYTDKDGNKQTTVFYNTGNTYRKVAEIYAKLGYADLTYKYALFYEGWLLQNYGEGADMNWQGIVYKT